MSIRLAWHLATEAAPVFSALRASSSDLDRLALRRLARTLREAMRAPLHRERLRAAGIDARFAAADPIGALRALSPLDKATLRAAGTAALRDSRIDRSWYASHSSGSTGEPFTMRFDVRGWAILKHLVKARSRAACGVSAASRIAILDAIPVADEGGSLIEQSGRVRRMSVRRAPDELARAIARFDPDVIYGLPSALLEAGSWLRCRRPIHVFTGGELIAPATRAALRSMYGGPVRDCYGTSETKEIAWECCAGGAHVNADVLHLEVLDDTGAPAAPGEEGALAVSVLVNDAMPLLRYRTGDRGVLTGAPCGCGVALPLLGVVTGRETDVLEVAGRRLTPYALTTALERAGFLERYQVTQLEPARIRVRAVPAPGVDHATAQRRVRDVLSDELPGTAHIEVEFIERFTATMGRKFRVIEPLAVPSASPESHP